MKPPQDPPRLLDPGSDAPAWLRASLEVGARDVPGPNRLAGIAARLPGGPSGPGPGRSGQSPPHLPPAAAPAAPSMLSGAALGAALGLAVLGAGRLASPRAESPPSPQTPIVAVAADAPRPPPLELAKAPSLRVPAVSSRPAALASVAALPPGATPPPSPGGAGSAAAPEADAPVAPVVAAETESSILQRAQDALRGSPAEALALTELHRARFPGGALGQEREVLAITALLGLGRGAEARARAARFLTSFPTSAHRRRLEVLIPDLQSTGTFHKESSADPSTL